MKHLIWLLPTVLLAPALVVAYMVLFGMHFSDDQTVTIIFMAGIGTIVGVICVVLEEIL